MNVIAEITRINQAELDSVVVGTSASWHTKYAESAWVYVGNLPVRLTEGDVICVMSQFGEVEDINLVRDSDTGKSRGFAFLKYEDARSCVLAVDNLTGSKILSRSLRIDHVDKYRLPKDLAVEENGGVDDGLALVDRTAPGHAYHGKELASSFDISKGQDLFAGPPPPSETACIINDHDERREAKRARKEARDRKRKEKEDRRARKEKNRHDKRSSKMKETGTRTVPDSESSFSTQTSGRRKTSREQKEKKRRRER